MAPSSKLTPSDAAVEKRFGQSVAISGTTVIAGAPQDQTLDVAHGAAYAFQLLPTGEWQETAKLISAQPRNNHLFGDSVAISGDTAVIGTHGEYASVFQRTSGTAWEEVIWLTPGPIWDSQSVDGFGWSVDLAADLAIVGAPNAEAAYIFDRNSGGTGNWGQVARLTPVGGSDPLHFGMSVAISNDMAIVGASREGANGPESGAAYIFEREPAGSGAWQQVARLLPAEIGENDRFGWDVAIEGDTAVVGSFLDHGTGIQSGSAYVFERNHGGSGQWGQVARLLPPDVTTQFGYSVDISGDTIVVGATDEIDRIGGAYFFDRDHGGTDHWGLVAKVEEAQALFGDFGNSVAISDGVAVVGAVYDMEHGHQAGAAYVYTIPEPSSVILLSTAAVTLIFIKRRSLKELKRAHMQRAGSVAILSILSLFWITPAPAEIFRWDNGRLILGTTGITPGPRVQLDHFHLQYADLANADLSEASLEFANLTNADLTGAILNRTNLANANLTGVRLEQSDLTSAYMGGINLTNATLSGAVLQGAFLRDADLTAAELKQSNLTSAEFGQANLTDADLTEALLENASLELADLTRAALEQSNMTGVRLGSATLRNADLTGAVLQDADLSNANLTGARLVQSNLTGVNLFSANLTNADLIGAIVSRADLAQTTSHGFTKEQLYSTASYEAGDLQGVFLWMNDLTGWDFSGQDLREASFLHSNSPNANFTGADLRDTHLGGVDLEGTTDFTGATFVQANLAGADLRNAILTSADFGGATISGTDLTQATAHGFTREQLYSTASYEAGDLQGTLFMLNDLSGWDFTAQDLSGASFWRANLANATMPGAILTGTQLSEATSHGFTLEQLYSTASYLDQDQNLRGINLSKNFLALGDFSGQDLSGANLSESNFTEANFTGADLTNADLADATLTHADLTGAIIAGANFADTTSRGFTKEQLYSTASYQSGNLQGISLVSNDHSGWDFSGQDLTDSRLDDLVNANLAGANLTGASTSGDWRNSNLAGAVLAHVRTLGTDFTGANFQDANLSNAALFGSNFTNADVTGANLTDAVLSGANLQDAVLTGAWVVGASFSSTTRNHFTQDQLYSTASYEAHNLARIDLSRNDLSGWDFSGQNLIGADFRSSQLSQTNFSRADLRSGRFHTPIPAIMDNTIHPDGRILGLNLATSETLVVRDFDFAVTVHEELNLDDGVLELVLVDAEWNSTVAVEEEIPVQLDGTLRVRFADETTPADLLGTSFNLFDWNGTLEPADRFARVELPAGEFHWDLSRLYTDGEVTLNNSLLPDYNANGLVEQGDLDLVLLNWGESVSDPNGKGWHNRLPNGRIDQEELDRILLNWGTKPAALGIASVPEPAGLWLAFCTVVVISANVRLSRPTRHRNVRSSAWLPLWIATSGISLAAEYEQLRL